jgi:4-hydroxy-3-methylbut-2-enyl diphosphate reductase IspH
MVKAIDDLDKTINDLTQAIVAYQQPTCTVEDVDKITNELNRQVRQTVYEKKNILN